MVLSLCSHELNHSSCSCAVHGARRPHPGSQTEILLALRVRGSGRPISGNRRDDRHYALVDSTPDQAGCVVHGGKGGGGREAPAARRRGRSLARSRSRPPRRDASRKRLPGHPQRRRSEARAGSALYAGLKDAPVDRAGTQRAVEREHRPGRIGADRVGQGRHQRLSGRSHSQGLPHRRRQDVSRARTFPRVAGQRRSACRDAGGCHSSRD